MAREGKTYTMAQDSSGREESFGGERKHGAPGREERLRDEEFSRGAVSSGQDEKAPRGSRITSRDDDYPQAPLEDMRAEEFTEDKSILSEDSFRPLDEHTHPLHR